MGRVIAAIALCAGLGLAAEAAGQDIHVSQDKMFVFAGLGTWNWHPGGAGEVKMALTPDDDPESVRKRFEPLIMQSVSQELGARGYSQATAGTPDLHVLYYLLVSTNMSAQTVGQFIPGTTEWGIPPFTGSTQSLRVVEQGSLVVDVLSPATNAVVWRGIAQAEVLRQKTDAQRDERIRRAIRDMFKKFPEKK